MGRRKRETFYAHRPMSLNIVDVRAIVNQALNKGSSLSAYKMHERIMSNKLRVKETARLEFMNFIGRSSEFARKYLRRLYAQVYENKGNNP